jgi:exopolysaccharide biosynthesis protein
LPASAQEFKTVRNGVEYAEFSRPIKPAEKETAQTASVRALRIDLKKARLDVVHAMDAAIGLEKTSSIAARHGALAAVNAGFFRIDNSIFRGDAVSVLKVNGKLLSESYPDRIALLIANKANQTNISFAHLNLSYCLSIKRTCYPAGLNRERKNNDSVIYTPDFHHTTLTASGGTEIVVKMGKIVQIVADRGSSLIPPDGFVLSLSGQKREQILPLLKVGTKVNFSMTNLPQNGNSSPAVTSADESFLLSQTAEDIVGGVPQLIKNGKIEITWEREKSSKSFVETRHPRTAIAKLKDGRALLVTVDGRSESSGGMNLQELAEMLLEMGATDAMNLDGGGSTTMFLDDKVVNKPSDKEGERPVSDAILVTLRK